MQENGFPVTVLSFISYEYDIKMIYIASYTRLIFENTFSAGIDMMLNGGKYITKHS